MILEGHEGSTHAAVFTRGECLDEHGSLGSLGWVFWGASREVLFLGLFDTHEYLCRASSLSAGALLLDACQKDTHEYF